MSSKYKVMLLNPHFNVFYNAPCLVFIVGPKKLRSIEGDCALAASYFMFSACTRGLSTCWIGLVRYINDSELLDLIGLPETDRIVAPVIIGYPKDIPGGARSPEDCLERVFYCDAAKDHCIVVLMIN